MILRKTLFTAFLLIALNVCGALGGTTVFGAENKKPAAKKSAHPKQSAAKPDKAAPSNSTKAAENSSTHTGTQTSPISNHSPAVNPSPDVGASQVLPSEDIFTSLIVDVTGFKLDRSMSPKILRSDGVCVWGSLIKLTEEQYAIIQERGMVAYVKTLEEARANSRAGLRPLIVRAIGTNGGKLCSDVIVSDSDAERILVEERKSKFLEVFNVIFVQNELPPKDEKPASDQTSDSAAVTKEGNAESDGSPRQESSTN